METSELIGMAIVFIAILLMTAQTAFAFGRKVGGNSERLLANKRVQGVLDYENRRPKSQKNKRKATRKRVAGELVGGVL